MASRGAFQEPPTRRLKRPPKSSGVTVRLRTVALYAAYGSNMDPEQMRARCPIHRNGAPGGWRAGA
jgi:hypothetical protein